MPKRVLPLSDVQVRNAKPKDKLYKLQDGSGLYLLVTPSGGKLWRFDYRYADKRKTMALGKYPEQTLSEMRQRRDEVRKLVSNGVDPGEVKKAKKAATVAETENAFEVVAREWLNGRKAEWSEGHRETVMGRLNYDVFPVFGARQVGDIEAPELLEMLRRIEARGAVETAHRVRTVCSQIFRFAIATGRAKRDPAADLRGALKSFTSRHHSAITDPQDVAPLLRAIDGYKGTFVVRQALRLAPLVFIRPGELRHAEWTEFDLENADWNIPIERMKMLTKKKIDRKGQKHLIPLSRQAVDVLRELQLYTGKSRYVFPCARSHARPMSENAVNGALRRMGFSKEEICGHGFRAMARTIMDEVLQVRVDLIEHQSAHAVKDPLGRVYNRTSFLPERREMMQKWADYLDGLKSGAKVLPLRKAEGGE